MGKIISFEGIHGCGKSTQARMLYSYLLDNNFDVRHFSSQDKSLSKYIMKFLEKEGPQSTEILFYLALANDLTLNKEFEENPNSIFILDRYIYTNIVSTYAAGKNIDWIMETAKILKSPDITYLLDLSSKEAYKRKNQITNEIERGEFQLKSSMQGFFKYQNKMRKAYLEIAKKDSKVIILNGMKSKNDCHQKILKSLENKL